MESTGKVEIVTLTLGFSSSVLWTLVEPVKSPGFVRNSSKHRMNYRDWGASVDGKEGPSVTIFVSIHPSLVIFIRIDYAQKHHALLS